MSREIEDILAKAKEISYREFYVRRPVFYTGRIHKESSSDYSIFYQIEENILVEKYCFWGRISYKIRVFSAEDDVYSIVLEIPEGWHDKISTVHLYRIRAQKICSYRIEFDKNGEHDRTNFYGWSFPNFREKLTMFYRIESAGGNEKLSEEEISGLLETPTCLKLPSQFEFIEKLFKQAKIKSPFFEREGIAGILFLEIPVETV